ncbi:MAG TPA: hypothetical protein VH277_04100, partial [Gemmatimonadaceae bacterium]|nr:hypothetical protein [Gemmatimonadaceae bacterium]
SLNNDCQNSRYPLSGAANGNSPGNGCDGDQKNPYFILNEVVRVSSGFLGNIATGALKMDSPARDARDRSFAEFLRGISLGYLALIYDSSAVVSALTKGDDPGKLVGYKEVLDSSNAALQRAMDLANTTASGQNGFPIPAAWIPSPTSYTADQFVRLIRSYRAMFNSDVARTPAERAALNWDNIIADAANGIPADMYQITSTTQGPGGGWRAIYDGGSTWHQMTPFIIGMADTSGNYDAWLRQGMNDRGAGNVGFTLSTPDMRFPQGDTRAAQQADFRIQDCEVAGTLSCKRYFTNRPNGSDQFTGNGWGWSNYDFNRFHGWNIKGDAGNPRNGTLLFFPKAVNDMILAEGYIRKGQFAQAAALINATRTTNGKLPAITAPDATTPVPGGSACVPRVPTGPSGPTTCGNMMEALKWEKRVEGAFVQFGSWYFNSRGWGDLAEGTPLFWAVPFEDLLSRGYTPDKVYGAGPGAGNAPSSAAAKSTSYGW